jgi:hypothetical protein
MTRLVGGAHAAKVPFGTLTVARVPFAASGQQAEVRR